MSTNANAAYLELGTELDRESWDWLVEADPKIAAAVELAVTRGGTPDGVRRFILARVGTNRVGLADRCEAASRWLLTRA